MSHRAQRIFCREVKRKFPNHFRDSLVIDVGSLDINGCNKGLFRRCEYTGIDIVGGANVDVVGPAHRMIPGIASAWKDIISARYRQWCEIDDNVVDVMISTEALEHDQHYEKTLRAMYQFLKQGGLMLITAAGVGRPEHGTTDHDAWASPGTNDYYRNVSNEMFAKVLPPDLFKVYHLAQHDENYDLQFYGIKKFKPIP